MEFELKYLGDNKFRLDAASENGSFELHKDASFGERISNKGRFLRD